MTIFTNSEIFDRLLIHTDPHTHEVLERTCSHFKRHLEDKRRYSQIACYVIAHFQIVSENFKSEPLWFKLKHVQVILFGEDHTLESERQIIAELIHRLWHSDSDAIQIEHEPHQGIGQMRYLKPAVARHVACWDVSSIQKRNSLSRAMILNALVTTQNAMKSRAKLPELIESYRKAIKEVENLIESTVEVLKKENTRRDFKFLSEINSKLDQKNRVLNICGLAHSLDDGHVASSLKKQDTSYLSLVGNQAYKKQRSSLHFSPQITNEEKRKLILDFDGIHIPTMLCWYPYIAIDVLREDLQNLEQSYLMLQKDLCNSQQSNLTWSKQRSQEVPIQT